MCDVGRALYGEWRGAVEAESGDEQGTRGAKILSVQFRDPWSGAEGGVTISRVATPSLIVSRDRRLSTFMTMPCGGPGGATPAPPPVEPPRHSAGRRT